MQFRKAFMSANINILKIYLLEQLALQKGRFFLWLPIFTAFGVGIYFSLPMEPPFLLSFIPALLLLGAALWSAKVPLTRKALLFALYIVLGFMAAQIRTSLVQTPMLQKKLAPVLVSGTIETLEKLEGGKGERILLRDLEIEKLTPVQTPRKIRLTNRYGKEGYALGERVRVLASLNPPSPPVMPAGFDFQRYMYFKSIGAVGFIYKKEASLKDPPSFSFKGWNERLRTKITQKVRENLNESVSSIAVALVTGKRKSIAQEDRDAMRESGLAHLLAISGLHVGLFAGVVFFFVRLAFVCVPGFALKHPVKKYAALAAIAGAAFYMMISGMSIPTQRALLMTSIIFLAIILDRSPVSLRLLAFAAIVVLFLFPESFLSASFHMSFAAVTALVLFYERITPFWSKWSAQSGFFKRCALYFAGVCMTTCVAGLATAPFALFHFQQMALYNILANLVAVPVVAFFVMPAAVLALALMPFGLEFFPLQVMGVGISGVLEVAHFVSKLPHAVQRAALWPLSALVLLSLSFLFMGLWKGHLRVLGLVPLCLSLLIIFLYKQPDILVSSKFNLIAFRAENGEFKISGRSKERFALEVWERSMGVEPGKGFKWPKEGQDDALICGAVGCRLELKGYKISFLKKPEALDEECLWADIILSFEPLIKQSCNTAYVLDKFDTYRGGAHALWLEEGGVLRMQNVESDRGGRPWNGALG